MENKPNSYRTIIGRMTASGYYCGDPVGKCLKHANIRDGDFKRDIHLCIKDSDTYAAFIRGEKIGDGFDKSRAIPGQLRWTDRMRPTPEEAPPCPILFDVASGVFRESASGRFGFISDVANCLFVRAETGKWEQFLPSCPQGKPEYFSAEEDIARAHEQLAQVGETTRSALIQARRGQGQYRQNLIVVWGKCAVTGCAHLDLLRASHIKPWRDSSPEERLDKFNGLLLTPNLDAAFDRGFIGFDDDGQMLISAALSVESVAHLGITQGLRLSHVYAENRSYLAFHRKLHEFAD
jgi:hypothetical protein